MKTLKAVTLLITLFAATQTMAKADGILDNFDFSFSQTDTFQNPIFNPANALAKVAYLTETAIRRELGHGYRVYSIHTHQGKYADNKFSQYRVSASVANDKQSTQFDCDFELSIRVMPFAKYAGDLLFHSKSNQYQIVGEVNSSSCQ